MILFACERNDVIALAFHYLEYDNDNPMTYEQHSFLCHVLNYIQFELGPKHKIRVGVLIYNEASEMWKYSVFR